MPATPHETILRQVRHVSRRLWMQNLLHGLLIGWAGTFMLAAAGILVRTLFWGRGTDEEGWITLGAAAALGVLAGVIWAWRRAPGRVVSALALDEKFALKERVTTFLTMSASQAQSPAGQALLEDVKVKVAGLRVAERFPITLPWQRVMMPLTACMLALLALFFSPEINFTSGGQAADAKNRLVADPAEAQKQLEKFKKDFADKDKKALSDREKELNDELKKLLDKDIDAKDDKQVRQTLEAMKTLEEKMRERANEFKEEAARSKETLKALEQLEKLTRKLKDGPFKDFQDALAAGNMKKAMDELDKLQKKLDNKELTKEERDRLNEQFEQLQRELERLRDRDREEDLKALRDKLQKQFENGELDKETLDRLNRELNELETDLDDLKDLADLLKECKNCKGDGDLKGKLKLLRGKLQKLDVDDEELERLLREQERLEAMRLAILRACQGNRPGGLPGQKRAAGPEPKLPSYNERQRGDPDPRGKMRITGFTKGGTFKKIDAKDVPGVLRQADQEASEVIDRQRIPADAADVAKGYFERLGGQK